MIADKTVSRPTVIFDLGGVLVSVDFMRACARLEAAGAAPAAVIRDAILGGAEKIGFDTGHLSPQEFAARFCATIGLRLPYSEFAEIWCDIFAEKREVTGLLDEIGKHADLVLLSNTCLLYTSDAADDLTRVDLGGRRIIKKKNNKKNTKLQH